MTPARSLAASVVALGFASALTAPQPALAAPAPCGQAENFAAQSGAELLRINKLVVRTSAGERPKARVSKSDGGVESASNRVLSGDADPSMPDPEDSDTVSESIGMIGTGVLGYLGTAPKPAAGTAPKQGAGTDGVAEVVPPAKRGPVDKVAEQGSDVVGGMTGGMGGGEPADDGSEEDQSSTGRDDKAGSPNADGNGEDADGANDSAGEGDKRADRATTRSLSEVGLGEARTAMIAKARITSAAYARMLDGSGKPASAKPLLQQAPPTNAEAARRSTPGGTAGPLTLGQGRLSTHAQWDAGMACGNVAGETGRADTTLTSLSLLKGDLVRVPGTMTSHGTTAIEHQNDEARTVARSTVTAGRIELAGGKVRLRVLRAPTLEAVMSANAGGKVNYRPAIVEVSGDGIATKRLSAAGQHVDIALKPERHSMESAMRSLGDLGRTAPMPVPTVPGLPPVANSEAVPAPEPESATADQKAIKLRVSLGDVRHAVKGHAIAARASAIKVSMTQSSGSKGRGQDSYGGRSDLSLTMSVGVLEAAAVSPDRPAVSSEGAGGGLPVTGPRLDRIAMAGGALLLAGIGAVLIGLRRRRTTQS